MAVPRSARLHLPGGVFHVISRWLERKFLLGLRGDREAYIDLLGRSLQRTDTEVLA